jgi:hypothetical protein
MKTSIYTQHFEHTEWLNALSFYKDELSILKSRLEEIARKNTSKEILARVEHFQNQFIIQEKNIDDIREEITKDEKKIAANVTNNPIATYHRKSEDHSFERDEVESFEKNFEDLRKEFKTFLFKWM